jgi:hypothetical protein
VWGYGSAASPASPTSHSERTRPIELVVRENRNFRDPETKERILNEEKTQLPDVVVVNQDEKTLVVIGEAKSGSERYINTVWDQLNQRVDSAQGKAEDAILVALTENKETGERKAFIKNGEANPELADKIGAALNDQGIEVKQQSATYVTPPSGLTKDPILEQDPIKEGFTYEPRGPQILITTRAPQGPRCCFTPIQDLPPFKEIFPIDPLGGAPAC